MYENHKSILLAYIDLDLKRCACIKKCKEENDKILSDRSRVVSEDGRTYGVMMLIYTQNMLDDISNLKTNFEDIQKEELRLIDELSKDISKNIHEKTLKYMKTEEIVDNIPVKLEKELLLYAVRSKNGKFYKSKGYGGYRNTVWMDDINEAKIYTKIGQARSVVTFFTGHYPDYGIPDLVIIKVNEVSLVNEKERVTKSIEKKQKEELECKKESALREIEYANKNIKDAEKRLKESLTNLEKLK
jgi:hypothetical protein